MNLTKLEEEVDFINNEISRCDKALPSRANDTVIFVGLTGAGKTTLYSLICGKNVKIIENPDDGSLIYDLENQHDFQKIGISTKSCTSIPNCKQIDKILYVDTPGLEGNDGCSQQIINAFYIKKVFSISSKVKIVLVIDYGTISISRGKNLADLFDHLLELIPDEQILSNCMSILITRCPSTYTSAAFANKANEFCTNNNSFNNSKDILSSIVSNVSKIILFQAPNNISDPIPDLKSRLLESLDTFNWSSIKINPTVGLSAQLKLKDIIRTLNIRMNNDFDEISNLIKFKFLSSFNKRVLNLLIFYLRSMQFSKKTKEFLKSLENLKNYLNSKNPYESYRNAINTNKLINVPYQKIIDANKLIKFYKLIIKINKPINSWKLVISKIISNLQSRISTIEMRERVRKAKADAEKKQQEIKRLEDEKKEAEKIREQQEIEKRKLQSQQEERQRYINQQIRIELERQADLRRRAQERPRIIYRSSSPLCGIF
ncbi:hypothetical protein SteCoe_35083 [Stentor coeruleus]|uniref:Uncharacterized protein n=1 Tax=Stentor coeruleus TaxID=5963 RepID=A0A1R2AT28_9CILI|nr:hypothetical protein SteCoe_35083 [Stentor coeruleus]